MPPVERNRFLRIFIVIACATVVFGVFRRIHPLGHDNDIVVDETLNWDVRMVPGEDCGPHVRAQTVKVGGVSVFYIEVGEISDDTVVLLHGAKYTHKDWCKSGTLEYLRQQNYRAIAIDLPGHGGTVRLPTRTTQSGFLSALLRVLNVYRPIIIAPSMSGEYILPLLSIQERSATEKMIRGVIAVAPVVPQALRDFDWQRRSARVPLLLIVGDADETLGPESEKQLKQYPGLQRQRIAGAGHACYLDDPEAFHKAIGGFLDQVK